MYYGKYFAKKTIADVIIVYEPKKDALIENITLKDRLKHFTLAWYTCTMSTGGVAFVLSTVPYRFDGLTTLGKVMFLFNLVLFTTVNFTMCARFIIHPGTFTRAFTNPHEGFFFATFWLTFATLISNTTVYGIPNTGPWLLTALRVAFWVYAVCTTIVAIFYYHILFTLKRLVWLLSNPPRTPSDSLRYSPIHSLAGPFPYSLLCSWEL